MSDADLLHHRVRPPAAGPAGALILFHGRGADENDLWPLFDMLDPDRRLVGASPRGPLSLPPGGAHWYQVRKVGYPDPSTFLPTFSKASAWLDAFLSSQGVEPSRTVLAGFSQGGVMSYALGLGPDRPRPAGLMIFSSFIPHVDDAPIDLEGLDGYPVAIGHGALDPVIQVEFGRDACDRLSAAGADVSYRESPMPHTIDPEWVEECRAWLARVIP